MRSRLFVPLVGIVVAVQLLVVTVSPVRGEDSVAGSPDVTITLRNGVGDREVSVPRGGIVRFVNRDDERHRLRSRSGEGFDTGNLEPGESFQVRLKTVGTYAYIDERADDDARYFGRIRVMGGDTGATGGGTTADGGATADGGTTGGGAIPGGGTAGAGDPASAAIVTIVDEAFDPGTTTIEVGGTVTFENLDGDEHTATSAGTGGIDSGVLTTGASYQKTFTQAGSFDFLCMFHPEMRGTIEVGGAPVDPAPNPASAQTPTPPPDATETAAVDIVDLAFEPASVEVVAGGSVTWTNTGVVPHTATSEDALFDSQALATGSTFTQAFATPGTFAYLCQIHPDMRGTVEVVEAQVGAAAQVAAPPADADAQPESPPPELAEASPAAAVDSPLTAGAVVAVALISIAVVLFAKVLAGTPRRVEEG